jgi:hypothetical protein
LAAVAEVAVVPLMLGKGMVVVELVSLMLEIVVLVAH